jgi:hypothetical protein
MHRAFIAGLAASIVLPTPVLAQSHYPERSRAGRVADEIARTVEDTAEAVATVRDSVDRSIYDMRFRGPERFAVDSCRPAVERYGRMRVQEVRPYKRYSFRVYGLTQGYVDPYYTGYRNSAYADRRFTCTVRSDGRVKVKTKRLRWH